MVNLGNVGSADISTVCIKEEPSFAGAIATATPYWLRKNRAFFRREPNIVDSDYANAICDGISKEVFHNTSGIIAAELDMVTIGELLKLFVGSKTSTAPSYKKHVFQPGINTLKSVKVIQDIGGMSTPLNNDFIGQAADRLSIIINMLETVKVESVWVGQTDQSGTLPAISGASKANPCEISTAPSAHTLLTGDTIKISGVVGMTQLNGNTYTVTKTGANTFTIGVDYSGYTTYSSGGTFAYEGAYAGDNMTVTFRDDAGNPAVKFYVGTVGETTIAGMGSAWADPYFCRLDMARNRKAQNYISDGTGKTPGITNGVLKSSINLLTTLTTNQKYSTFRLGTEVSFGIRLDTGVIISGSDTYKLDMIFPRVTIASYDCNIDGTGTILPGLQLKPQKDPTALYPFSFELFNNTTDYPDST